MPQFITTAAGDAAASLATPTGPYINIVGFKVGDDYSTPATPLDTDLAGNVLYSSAPSSYSILDDSTLGIRLEIPAAVGPFQFGEIGLYLPGNVLYARCSFGSPQQKLVSTITSVPSVWRITAALKLAQAPSLFNIATQSQNMILEVANFSFISGPGSMVGSPNAVIVHEASPRGEAPLLWKTSSTRWSIAGYDYQGDAIVISATGTTVTSAYFAALTSALPRELLVESSTGDVRAVASITGSVATLTQPLGGLTAGAILRVHRAPSSSFSAPRVGASEFNQLATLFNELWSTPSNSGTSDAVGWGQTAVPTIPAGTVPTWSQLTVPMDSALLQAGIPNFLPFTGMQSDWSIGFVDNSSRYYNLVGLMNRLRGSRPNQIPPVNLTQTASGVSVTRTTNYTQIHHDVSVAFPSVNSAAAYFNAGGYVGFNLSITPDNMAQSMQDVVLASLGTIAFRAQDSSSLGGHKVFYVDGDGNSTATGRCGFHGLTSSRRKVWSYHIPVGSQPGVSPISGYISLEMFATQISAVNFNLEFWITDNLGSAYSSAIVSSALQIISSIEFGVPSSTMLSNPVLSPPTVSTLVSTIW